MKHLLLLFAALLCLALPVFAQNYPPSAETNNPSFATSYVLQGIEQRLQQLETLYQDKLDYYEQEKAQELADEIRSLAMLLSDAAQQGNHGYPSLTMNHRQFEDFLQAVVKAVFSDDQLKLIQSAADENYFSAGQIAEVLVKLVFSDDQIDALKIMYPSCIDRGETYKILEVFTFDSDRAQAEEIINKEE